MATITKRPNGRWQAKIRRRGQKPISRTFSFQVDARAWAREVESAMDRGGFGHSTLLRSWTVASVLDRYAEKVVPRLKPSGQKHAIDEINRFKAMPISNCTLDSLRVSHLTELRDELLCQSSPRGGTIKPATVLRRLSVLRSALNSFVEAGVIDGWDHPMRLMKMPKASDPRDRLFEPDEIVRLIAAWRAQSKERIRMGDGTSRWVPLAKHSGAQGCRNPYVALIFKLAIETGMRRGELLAVEIKHIHPERGYIFLPPDITKTAKGRQVPLTPHAKELIRRALRVEDRDANEKLLFPISANAFKKAWQRLLKRAGLDKSDLRFHDTRAQCATRCIEEGLTGFDAMVQTGHRDVRSMKRYVRVRATTVAEKRAINAMNRRQSAQNS